MVREAPQSRSRTRAVCHAAKRCGRGKLMLPGGNKMFLSPKEALVWSEAQLCARNGFGHFLSAFALSPAPSMSSVVTTQSPVLGGDELQGLPVLAQLGVTDLCPTSNSRAGSFLFPCPQDEDISPRPLHSSTSRRTCLQGCRCENTLPGIWDMRVFFCFGGWIPELSKELCTQSCIVTCAPGARGSL